jgi:two-component system, sensor histidine kinase and response regulator
MDRVPVPPGMAETVNRAMQDTSNGPRSWGGKLVSRQLVAQVIAWAVFMLLDRASGMLQVWAGIPAWSLPAGLSMALFLWGGWRYVPVMVVASVTAAIFDYHRPPMSWTGIPGPAVLALPAAAGAALLRGKWRFNPGLRRLRDVGGLVLLLPTAVLVSAVIGARWLVEDSLVTHSRYSRAAFNWWVGDSISVASFTPVLLLYVMPWVKLWLGPATPVRRIAARIRLPRISPTMLEPVAGSLAIVAAVWLVFGFKPGIPYQPLYVLFFPIIWIAVRHGLRRTTLAILATNAGVTIAARLTHPDAEGLPRLQLVMLALALTGLCLGAVVSDRDQAEDALRASELQYHTLFRSISEPVFICDATATRFLDCNDAACKLYGYSHAEIKTLKPIELHPPEERATMRDEVAAGGFGATWAYTHLTKDGRRLPVEINVAPTEYQGQQARIAIVRDVSLRRHAEQALRASESKYRALFEHVSDPIFILDANTYQYLDCNETASRVYGYSRDEILRMTPFDVRSPEARQSLQEDLAALAASSAAAGIPGSRVCSTTTHLTKAGRRMEVEVLADRIEYEGRAAIIALVRDVTTQKAAEAHLIKAKAAAEAASRAKTEFLANMSHEVRTPLNGILGMTDLVLDTQVTAEQQDYLQMLKSSADLLLTIVNDVLDFSKVEAGRLELERVEFNLRSALREVTKTFALRAHDKQIELLYDIGPEVPDLVVGDPTRLRQIVVNLLGNALKFTDKGEVLLKVETESLSQDSVTLHFAVRDTGIGIPADKQRVIFEAFSQADGSMTRRFGGTGLGLTISSRLAEAMGGRLWVESELGKGSVFHFTALLRSVTTPTIVPSPSAAGLDGLRVLVVDDNASSRRILSGILQRWSMSAFEAASGPEALALLAEAGDTGSQFDLLLADAGMPGVDGFELVEKLRQHPATNLPAVILLTSAGRRGDGALCRQLGVCAYLTKPIADAELRVALLSVLDHRQDTIESRKLVTRHSLREQQQELHSPASLRVLVAEDNLVNQRLTARLLEKRGHSVTIVENGREALQALGEATFDVALLDVQMPEMDGFETAAAIRSQEETTGRHLPIVAMTAHALKQDEERCRAAGMDGYVSKPIQPQQLFATIESLSSKG